MRVWERANVKEGLMGEPWVPHDFEEMRGNG